LFDITTNRYINIQNKNAGVSGNNFVRKNENKFVRSPEKDCYVTTPTGLSKTISFSGLEAETPEITSREELKTFLETLKDEKGKPKFTEDCIKNILSNAKTPENIYLAKKLVQTKKLDVYPNYIEEILKRTKTPEMALLKAELVDKLAPMEKIGKEQILNILSSVKIPEHVHLADELTKIERVDGKYIVQTILGAPTPELALAKADLAKKLAPIKEFDGLDIVSIVYYTQTPEQALVNADLAGKLTKIKKIENQYLRGILCHTNTPENIHLIKDLVKMEKLSGWDILTIVQDIETPKEAVIKTNLVKKLAPIERFNGHDISQIVYYIKIPEHAHLAEKLMKIERFSGEDIGNIIYYAKTPKHVQAAEKMVQIEKLNYGQIARTLYYAKTPEQALTRADFASKLAPIEKLNGDQIEWTVGLANTSEQVLVRTDLAKKLAPMKKIDGHDIAALISYGNVKTSEQAALEIKLLNDKAFTAKFDAMEQPLGHSILITALRMNTTAEKLDLERISKLYNFMSENKTTLEQFNEEKISDKNIANLFSPNMIKSFDILDDGVIKYAMKLKSNGFENFIDGTSELKNKLRSGNYSLLKENLSKLTMPEQKLEKIQCMTSLVNGEFFNDEIEEGINLIKSPKTTVNQIMAAEDIFTSNKSYPEQIQEFLTKFNVPAERQDRIVAFLEKNKLNEKVIVDNKAGAKTLSSSAKQELAPQIEAHINVINNNKEFNNFINAKIYDKLDLKSTPKLVEKLNFDQHYLPNLFSAVLDEKFLPGFKKLVELVNTNPSKPLSELRESLPENQQTKELFRENGINYEKWINFDKNSIKPFSFETNVEDAIKSVERNIVKELNGDLFKSVDKTETDKVLEALTDEGYKINAEKITKNGETIGQKDLEKIVDVFKDTINENKDFWDKPLADTKQENLKNELINHLLKGRKKEVADLSQMKNTKMDLNVRLSDDDDIGRNLFLGNHVGCCTSVDGCNNFAATQHLMNSFVRAIEIVDKSGTSYGNSMCYFAKVDDKLSFIVDSFEANGKLGGNVAVTDAIVDYAKQVTKEMGKKDIPIYFGPNYNKINMDKLEKTKNHTVKIIGRVKNETYIDAIGGNADVNVAHYNRTLFEINSPFIP